MTELTKLSRVDSVLVSEVPVRQAGANVALGLALSQQIADLLGDLADGPVGEVAAVRAYPVDEGGEDGLRGRARQL